MSKKRRDKLLAKIKENPKHVTFDELKKLFEMFNFEVEAPKGGSHYKARLNEYRFILSKPHGKHLKETYVKEALMIFEEIRDNEEGTSAEKT